MKQNKYKKRRTQEGGVGRIENSKTREKNKEERNEEAATW